MDLAVQFIGAAEHPDAAYDFCSGLVHEIMAKHTEFRPSDYNRFEDEIIFHYSLGLNEISPREIIAKLRAIVGG